MGVFRTDIILAESTLSFRASKGNQSIRWFEDIWQFNAGFRTGTAKVFIGIHGINWN